MMIKMGRSVDAGPAGSPSSEDVGAPGRAGSLWSEGLGDSDPTTTMPVAADPAMGAPAPVPARAAVGQVLPIYFVGDESHSMAGDPIAAVNQGLVDLRDEVAKHPLIGKKVRFGIITFADTADPRRAWSSPS